jgi:DNA polymerase/3'-5' exonuclease PolX
MEEILQRLYGIGPVVARKLKAELIAQGLAKSHTNYNEDQVRQMLIHPKIFDTLPVSTKIDLRYRPIKNIPRDLIHVMDGELRKYLRGVKYEIAGSYRRNKPISHDIDMVVSKGRTGPEVIDCMIHSVNARSKILHIFTPYARGDDKVNFLIGIRVPLELRSHELLRPALQYREAKGMVYFKVDAFLTEPSEYMYTLLFATGSGTFNVRMRALAKRKGYLLNQRGLFKKINDNVLQRVPIHTERELFRFLNMRYRVPEERTG